MKLLFNPVSPFARKVHVVARERGLIDRITLQPVAPLPTRPVAELAQANPIGKVPALVLDDGSALYDSRVIAEYFDAIGTAGTPLFPPAGAARWTALRRQSLGDGIMDAGVSIRYERVVRPPEHLFPDWVEGQRRKILQSLDVLEKEARILFGDLTIGHIAIACALGYLDFRFADEEWRKGRPALAEFYSGISARPSMSATAPPPS
jgi:glutathione S-transferase